MGELVFLGILMLASSGAFVQSFFFQQSKYDLSGGPGLFPRIIGAALFISCLILFVKLLVTKKYKDRKFVFLDLFKDSRGVFLAAAWVLAILINYLGFLISVSIYLLFTIHYMLFKTNGTLGGGKRIALRSICIVASVWAIEVLFIDAFKIMLPVGSLIS